MLENPSLKNIKINIVDVQKGSIKITFEGSEEDLKLIEELIKSEQLTEVSGRTIQNVRLIDSEVEERQLRDKVRQKNKLIEEIRSQKIAARSLNKVALELSDLSEIFLKQAKM